MADDRSGVKLLAVAVDPEVVRTLTEIDILLGLILLRLRPSRAA
jgi:hypothetical protein